MVAAVGEADSVRNRPRVWWLPPFIWVITIASLVAALPLIGQTSDATDTLLVPLFAVMIGSFATVGSLLASRLPTNPIGWQFAAAGLMISLALFTQGAVSRALDAGPVPDLVLVPATVATALFQPALVVAGLVVLVFPDGRLLRWGRVVLAVIVVGLILAMTSQLLSPEATLRPGTPNPLAQPGLVQLLGAFELVGNSLLVVGFLSATINLGVRYRAANETERKQLHWFAYVAVVLAVSLAVASIQAGLVSDIAWIVAFGAFAALPIAIAIAVLRYRLYDIDLIVNRTLVYVPLLALLSGLFAAGIAFFERVFIALTGGESDAGIVLAALVVGAAFEPLRRKLEAVVDRWFKPAPTAVVAVPTSDSGRLSIDDPRLEAYVESVVRRVLDEQR